MNGRKKIGSVLLAGLVVLSAMMMLATPAVAVTNLWVVPENPTRYTDETEVPFVSQTVIKDVMMGLTYVDNVLVLCKTTQGQVSEANDIDLYFLVSATDRACIDNVTIGEAWRVDPSIPSETLNVADQTPIVIQQEDFIPIDNNGEQRDGYGASYFIGDLPKLGNPNAIGNVDNLSTFHPEYAEPHIRVPVSINFNEIPPAGFMLYFYAENVTTDVHMVWSHDCGFYNVPEFTTIAIPVATILGLLFFFNHRKKRRE
jgi:hypothetical protein